MKTWETLAKDDELKFQDKYYKIIERLGDIVFMCEFFLKGRGPSYFMEINDLQAYGYTVRQINPESPYKFVSGKSEFSFQQPEPKECEQKKQVWAHRLELDAWEQNKKSQPDTITIDGCEYTKEQLWAALHAMVLCTGCHEQVQLFKSALQKTKVGGGV